MLSLSFFKYAGVMSRQQTFRISSCMVCRDDGSAAHTLFFIIRQQFSMSPKSGCYQAHPTHQSHVELAIL